MYDRTSESVQVNYATEHNFSLRSQDLGEHPSNPGNIKATH